jgi:hypothetical protein
VGVFHQHDAQIVVSHPMGFELADEVPQSLPDRRDVRLTCVRGENQALRRHFADGSDIVFYGNMIDRQIALAVFDVNPFPFSQLGLLTNAETEGGP